jgi:hypothetical protein
MATATSTSATERDPALTRTLAFELARECVRMNVITERSAGTKGVGSWRASTMTS